VSEVPVYSPAGRLLSWAPLEWCERHAPHLRLVRTRRGVLKRAMLRSGDGGLVEWLEERAAIQLRARVPAAPALRAGCLGTEGSARKQPVGREWLTR
jgi:predicted pyridoxine 5'-phosphate oxidase superfamily flavin-nucleotide-binding protein